VNATIKLSPLFVPVISHYHSPFNTPTPFHIMQPLLKHHHHHHNLCRTTTPFVQHSSTYAKSPFFSTYAPCVISRKSYAHHICCIYAPCNFSTILPHALNQNNNALCFPLSSPMPKFKIHLCLYAYAPPFRSSSLPTYGFNSASPLGHIFIVDAHFQDILQETWS
jgi:hypothetical protein